MNVTSVNCQPNHCPGQTHARGVFYCLSAVEYGSDSATTTNPRHTPSAMIEQIIAALECPQIRVQIITPIMTDEFKVPNPCTSCHNDTLTNWTRETPRDWFNFSPWRLE